MSGSLRNLLYVSGNPTRANVCPGCAHFIGHVFTPGHELPLPAHPSCYCFYLPTNLDQTVWDWDLVPDSTLDYWIRFAAWLLRQGIPLALALEALRQAAEELNEELSEEEQEKEDQDMPDDLHAASEVLLSQANTGRVLLAPRDQPTGPAWTRREFDCVFMQPGLVRCADGTDSNWLIPADVIRSAAHKFNALSVYIDHPGQWGMWGDRNAPQVKHLAGVTFGAQWDDVLNALVGGIRLYDQDPHSPGAIMGALFDQILADQATGLEVPPIGLSAVFYQRSELDDDSGRRITTEIVHAQSVDFVYSAGAGGYVRAALASLQGDSRPAHTGAQAPGENKMSEERLTPQGHNDAAPAIITPSTDAASDPTAVPELEWLEMHRRIDELSATITTLTANIAEREETSTIEGMGTPPRSRISVGPNSLHQVELAIEAMLEGVRPPDGIRPLTGIRELYHLMSGDYEMSGVFQPDRVYLANVTSSTMAAIVANALNKRVMTLFQNYPQWWGPAVSIQDFATLQDVRWIVLGGVGELPTVSEGAAYTELTWDDKTETASFVKKGGYLGITIEAIDKDDTRRIRMAPQALAQAAWMTLGKTISAIFTTASGTGPTMADAVVLFHAGSHSNLGSSALSVAAWKATKIAMMKQAELHSAERLGAITAPKFLWVPIDLEDAAAVILASANEPTTADNDINPFAQGNARETRLANARSRIITVPFWTDTDNWAAQADPNLYPSIGLGFRYGRTPEIFSVADPRAGLMFSNDVMPVKVRFLYAAGAIDHRGLYKHNL